jgi:hypothetical protein
MMTRRRLTRLGLSAFVYPVFVVGPAGAAGPTIHVAANGNDDGDGAQPERPVRSFARAHALAAPGSTIKLKRGDIWHERLHVSKDGINVVAYGSGANPRIVGDRSGSCIWVSAANASIADIDCQHARSGLLIQGKGASASVRGGQFSECGTGISAGGAGKLGWGGPGLGPQVFGQLILADGVTCVRNRIALGAADGIQIGEDATADVTHTIRNSTCQFNEWGGVNAKAGTVVVENCNLSFNGQTGWTAQNNVRAFHITGCVIDGNSAAEKGTAQASVEDSAVVHSRRNIYRNPHNAAGDQYTLHIRVVGQPKSPYPQGPALSCVADTFINRIGQTRTLGSIGLHMGERFPASLSVMQCTFDHADGSGSAIDGYAAPLLNLVAKNNIFSMGNCLALRLHPRANIAKQVDHNLYFGSKALVAIRDGRVYPRSKFRQLFADLGIEEHGLFGDPLFRNAAAGDYRLAKNSPAIGVGAIGLGASTDSPEGARSGRPDLGAYPFVK